MGADIESRLLAQANCASPPEDELLREAAAEIEKLRWEVAALRQCGVKYLGWLGVKNAEKALRKDMANPEMVERPAPAMPNGVEGLVVSWRAEADEMPVSYRNDESRGYNNALYHLADELEAALRAADNRDAAGVAAPHWCKNCLGVAQESCPFNTTRDGPTPAAVPAGEAVADDEVAADNAKAADRACLLAIANGYAWDGAAWVKPPAPQPADGEASMFAGQSDAQIAHAVRMAEQHYRSLGRDPVYCNVSLSVLRDCTPPAPVQAAPQEGEDAAIAAAFREVGACSYAQDGVAGELFAEVRKRAALAARPSACELGAVREVIDRRKAEAEKRSRADDGYTMGWSDGVAGFARELEAALQHRGDSRGGDGS